jgi:hypothetical protein
LLSEAYVKVLSADFLSTSLALSLQFFSLPKASHTKRPKIKAFSQYSKAKSPPQQKAHVKPQRAKAPPPSSGVFYSSKQGGTMGSGVTLQQEKPAFLLL